MQRLVGRCQNKCNKMNWKEQSIILWGDRWKSTLALTVGVTKRTVQRWNGGHSPISQDIIDKINQTFTVWR